MVRLRRHQEGDQTRAQNGDVIPPYQNQLHFGPQNGDVIPPYQNQLFFEPQTAGRQEGGPRQHGTQADVSGGFRPPGMSE